MTGTLKSLNGTEFEGYEIHMGKSEFSVPCMTKLSNGKHGIPIEIKRGQ